MFASLHSAAKNGTRNLPGGLAVWPRSASREQTAPSGASWAWRLKMLVDMTMQTAWPSIKCGSPGTSCPTAPPPSHTRVHQVSPAHGSSHDEGTCTGVRVDHDRRVCTQGPNNQMRTGTRAHTHVHTHAHTRTHMHAHADCTCTYVCTHVHTHAHMCAHTCTHV